MMKRIQQKKKSYAFVVVVVDVGQGQIVTIKFADVKIIYFVEQKKSE